MKIDNLTLEELVKHINNELSDGRSMKDIEETDFDVNERVISKRLSRKGYKRIDNQFVKCGDITKVIRKDNMVKEAIPVPVKDKKDNTKNSDLDMERLKELIELIEPIKEVIQEYNKSKTYVEVKPIELRPKAIVEVKQKLFKIDVDVLAKWDKFVEDHKEYKVQQLISLALEEFIQKYN